MMRVGDVNAIAFCVHGNGGGFVDRAAGRAWGPPGGDRGAVEIDLHDPRAALANDVSKVIAENENIARAINPRRRSPPFRDETSKIVELLDAMIADVGDVDVPL